MNYIAVGKVSYEFCRVLYKATMLTALTKIEIEVLLNYNVLIMILGVHTYNDL